MLSNITYYELRQANIKKRSVSPIQQDIVIRAVGNLVFSIVDDIIAIQDERDSENHPTDEMPPVLHHELVKLCMGELG